MKTKLDHIYGASGGASNEQLESIENRLTTLSNSAAKINVAQSFTGLQTFTNGAASNVSPTANTHLANKAYVDNRYPGYTLLQDWSGNFKTTDLTWTKQLTNGFYDFVVLVVNQGWKSTASFKIEVSSSNNKTVTPVFLFNWRNETSNAIQPLGGNGWYFVWNGTQIKIIKVGEDQPTTSTSIYIYYKKIV